SRCLCLGPSRLTCRATSLRRWWPASISFCSAKSINPSSAERSTGSETFPHPPPTKNPSLQTAPICGDILVLLIHYPEPMPLSYLIVLLSGPSSRQGRVS